MTEKIDKNILEIYGDGAIKIKDVEKKNMNLINIKWKEFKDKKFLKNYEDLFYLGSKNDSPRRFHYSSIVCGFYLLTRFISEEKGKNVNIILEILCNLFDIDIGKNRKLSLINKIENTFKNFILDFSYVNKKKTPLIINLVNIITVFLNYYLGEKTKKIHKQNNEYLSFYFDFIHKIFLKKKFYIYFNNIKLKYKHEDKLRYETEESNIYNINEVNIINDIFIDNISYLSKLDKESLNDLNKDVDYFFNDILENKTVCKETLPNFLFDLKKNTHIFYKLSFILIFNTLALIHYESRMNINLELGIYEKVKVNNKISVTKTRDSIKNHLERIIFDDNFNVDNINENYHPNFSNIYLKNKLRYFKGSNENLNSKYDVVEYRLMNKLWSSSDLRYYTEKVGILNLNKGLKNLSYDKPDTLSSE